MNNFNPFFQKKSKITFFRCFAQKFTIFKNEISGNFFRWNSLKKYKFEEFLHILPFSTLKRVKLWFLSILTKRSIYMSYIVTTHIFSYHFVENYSKNVFEHFQSIFFEKSRKSRIFIVLPQNSSFFKKTIPCHFFAKFP